VHAITAHQDHISDLAVRDPFLQFLQGPAVARHQSHTDFQVLGGCVFRQLQHFAAARAVDSDGLFHEHIQPFGDGVGKMHPTKCRRRRQNHDVAGLQTIHGLFVAVETDKFAIRRHVDFVTVLAFNSIVAAVELVFENIRHGDQLQRPAVAGKRIGRGAAAAPAATDQCNLDQLGARGVDLGERYAGQSRRGRDAARGLDKLAARGERIRGGFVHSDQYHHYGCACLSISKRGGG
jgi:hypothetical protein